jgi:hypothetical protein
MSINCDIFQDRDCGICYGNIQEQCTGGKEVFRKHITEATFGDKTDIMSFFSGALIVSDSDFGGDFDFNLLEGWS